ncbi:hypothetical protein IVA96_32765 [Bradyrhizobium sp. 159]|uniref:hypothetical protein n=1 Tax=Bradyrhizobium sp. 159 TaxID=2782632 RepID=UPI001FF74AED|nr:hypothetical protein [Bradyrhizobium sp. 159]MCK1621254.1 hypothetical protein [Bradyrhizobium sp. 159]
MSILGSVASILGLTKILGIGDPTEQWTPTKADSCDDGKQSKWNDDHGVREDYSKNGDKDDYSNLSGKVGYANARKGDYSEHHGGWKDTNNDDHQPKDWYELKPSADSGEGDNYRNPGEALAKCDFSHGDFGSHSPDHTGDIHGALASMSSDDALEYAIGQMGPADADHVDVGHFDAATDTSHNTDA